MPGGTQNTSTGGTSSTSVAAPVAVNPTLNNLFTGLFGGNSGGTLAGGIGKAFTGALSGSSVGSNLQNLFTQGPGAAAQGTLSDIWSGSKLGSNISQVYRTLSQQGQQGTQAALASIKNAAGSTGMGNSSGTGQQVSNYLQQYTANLNAQATQSGLSEEQVQAASSGSYLNEIFGTALGTSQMQAGSAATGLQILAGGGNQYYSPGTSSTQTGSSSTSLPWTAGFSSIASLFA